jgi:hypothetical protein
MKGLKMFRKLPVVLNIIPKATYDVFTGKNRSKRPIKKIRNRNLMRLSEQLLEMVSVFMEASRNFARNFDMDQDILL